MRRLDNHLVALGLFETRSRARDAIVRGTVLVDGRTNSKPGTMVARDTVIEVSDPAAGYVSRAALKLIKALDHFELDPSERTALDVGASTGGFTQVLLERGAAHVFALDVGSGQLHEKLRQDGRVTNLEGVNARDLDITEDGPLSGSSITAIVSDVSFISLRLALPKALDFAAHGAFAALLVKPQFEVGRGHIGKGGLVTDSALAEATAERLSEWLDAQQGWRSLGLAPSPITGSDGNTEFLLGGMKDRR